MIREGLQNTIVLTITHRLDTVLDYDRVLVMEEGTVVDFDTPVALLKEPEGVFRAMCIASPDWSRLKERVKAEI